jgi:hypothetical protein
MQPSEMSDNQLLIQYEKLVMLLAISYSQEYDIAYSQAKNEILKRMS